jgi:uncharacterized protein YwbE
MLRSAHDLHGFTLRATDGEIGHVRQFYFDDEQWAIRYLVVDTGGWLSGRRVLISPIALGETDWQAGWIAVHLTRRQVEQSPDIDTDQPVSRQQEASYHQYYRWPYYWGGYGLWGGGMYPGMLLPLAGSAAGAAASGEPDREAPPEGDPHLRSTGEVNGYGIRAADGEIGRVTDFIVEDETWAIRYLAVDAGSWWSGKTVLIAPEWISGVSWDEDTVDVELKRETIKNGPEWHPNTPITREFEERLYGYYHRRPYWDRRDQAA